MKGNGRRQHLDDLAGGQTVKGGRIAELLQVQLGVGNRLTAEVTVIHGQDAVLTPTQLNVVQVIHQSLNAGLILDQDTVGRIQNYVAT